jgi:modulator of FtsH protease
MEGWDNFFLGHVGASAALGGLLFVAISLNLSQISTAAGLADRALLALSLLLAILVASSFMLIPDQPGLLLGSEVLLVGLGLTALAVTKRPRSPDRGGSHSDTKSAVNMLLLAIAVVPYLAGGVLIAAGQLRAGLYFVAGAIILSFVKAVLDAWVLLIEINR